MGQRSPINLVAVGKSHFAAKEFYFLLGKTTMRRILVSSLMAIASTSAVAGTHITCEKSPFKIEIDVDSVTRSSGAKESHFVVYREGVEALNKFFISRQEGYNEEMRAYVWGFRNNDNEQIGVGTRMMPNNVPAIGTWSAKAQAQIVTRQGTFSAGLLDMAQCQVQITSL